MHRGVGKAPERIRLVGQKVGSDEGVFDGPDDFSAERALSPPGSDPIHDYKMAPGSATGESPDKYAGRRKRMLVLAEARIL